MKRSTRSALEPSKKGRWHWMRVCAQLPRPSPTARAQFPACRAETHRAKSPDSPRGTGPKSTWRTASPAGSQSQAGAVSRVRHPVRGLRSVHRKTETPTWRLRQSEHQRRALACAQSGLWMRLTRRSCLNAERRRFPSSRRCYGRS